MIERRFAWLLVAGLAILVLAGCVPAPTSGAHGSRAVLYDSIEAMGADSSAVVIGTVIGQSEVKDVPGSEAAFTLSTFEVSKSLDTLPLGANVKDPFATVAEGTTIIVRQVGTEQVGDSPTELLREANEYLLFLVPSGLDGDAAGHFYVTGGNAGLYVSSGNSTRGSEKDYVQVDRQEGEDLPEVLDSSLRF